MVDVIQIGRFVDDNKFLVPFQGVQDIIRNWFPATDNDFNADEVACGYDIFEQPADTGKTMAGREFQRSIMDFLEWFASDTTNVTR